MVFKFIAATKRTITIFVKGRGKWLTEIIMEVFLASFWVRRNDVFIFFFFEKSEMAGGRASVLYYVGKASTCFSLQRLFVIVQTRSKRDTNI